MDNAIKKINLGGSFYAIKGAGGYLVYDSSKPHAFYRSNDKSGMPNHAYVGLTLTIKVARSLTKGCK